MLQALAPFAGALGSIGQGVLNFLGQNQANQQNQQQFHSNQAWNTWAIGNAQQYNTHMANTAHQREVADLKAAGINPMMTAMGGTGAPAPTSPTSNPGVGNAAQNTRPGDAIGGAVSSALSAAKTLADIKNVDKDALLKEASATAQIAHAQQSTASAKQLAEQTTQLGRRRDAEAARADADKNKAQLDQTYNATERLLGVIKQGSGITRDAAGSIGDLLPSRLFKDAIQRGWNEGFKRGTRNGIPLP